MMKKLMASMVIFTILCSTTVYAINYSYNASIESKGSHKYKAIRLTPEVYNKIRKDMSDIELYDKDNEPVPYSINSFLESEVESKKNYKKEYFVNSISPEFSAEERRNTTVLKIQGLRNLKLSSITLKTDNIFKRKVTFDGGISKVLYNLNFENAAYSDLTIQLNLYKVADDTVEIVIDNKDDEPITVQGIEAKYIADELIFDGSKSDEFTLKFGNAEIQNPKNYDISNYKDLILKEGYDVLDIREIKGESSIISIKPQNDYKLIFNIIISVTAIVMGIIIFLKLKK
ncbi:MULTISPECIES: hypothetical protein [unclassified Clostridium]|uniref:hypothetical protein n=1 Tax=unclassified Clostridium TaxID=2614128 RepID=UPI0002980AC3|nr:MULTISPECIES: hypothetical protein [unclassified Clostridium]EKQ56844.1 MAG: hypothetical protein A370_01620 [Clostridium sp. Maddingley MBC34-26]